MLVHRLFAFWLQSILHSLFITGGELMYIYIYIHNYAYDACYPQQVVLLALDFVWHFVSLIWGVAERATYIWLCLFRGDPQMVALLAVSL